VTKDYLGVKLDYGVMCRVGRDEWIFVLAVERNKRRIDVDASVKQFVNLSV
jgi:hypothetical protein